MYAVAQRAFRKRYRPSWPQPREKPWFMGPKDAKVPWRDEFSDGCTLVANVPETMHCCLAHDKAYYEAKGGWRGRMRADRAFLACMKEHGWTWRARLRWLGVRLGGWVAWYT